MLVKNVNGKLIIDAAIQVGPTPNKSGKLKSVDYIVDHYTAGGYPTDSSVKSMLDPNSKRSAHLFVDYNGKVYQLASLDDRCWHAGESSWQGKQYLNGYSIGIEFANPGLLSYKNDTYITYFGKEINKDSVIELPIPNSTESGFWCMYTDIQLLIAYELHRALIDYFPIKDILGHSDISPGRKIDPGPMFPISEYRQMLTKPKLQVAVASVEDDDDELETVSIKTTANVNLRQQPSTGSPVLTTIPQGTVLNGTLDGGGWYVVDYTLKAGTVLHGYISAQYALAQ